MSSSSSNSIRLDINTNKKNIRNKLQIPCFLLNSGLGISFLVFINAAQPFILREIVHAEQDESARISSTLIFADELLALATVLIWGRLADTFSPNTITASANVIIAISLLLTTQVKNVFPALLLTRLLFSLGASGLTTMLSANLSILQTAQSSLSDDVVNSPDIIDEQQPLLGWRRAPPASENTKSSLAARKPAALSAFLGISAGLGALLAVFAYLRLPIWLSGTSSTSTAQSLEITISVVAGIALLNAVVAILFLPRGFEQTSEMEPSGEQSITSKRLGTTVIVANALKREFKQIFRGFRLATADSTIALACLGGFAARAQTIAVSAFVPIYVASYYFKRGLCDPTSPDDLKQSCHEAYALASAVTGSTQLIALLSAVAFLSVTRLPRTLCLTSLLGFLSFLLLGRSFFGPAFGGDNPKNIGTWISIVGIGIAQTGSVTLSLALVAKARGRLLPRNESADEQEGVEAIATHIPATGSQQMSRAETSGYSEHSQDGDVAGALAGLYSFSGGLGVLVVSGLSGLFSFSTRQSAPFVVISIIDLLLVTAAFRVWRRQRAA